MPDSSGTQEKPNDRLPRNVRILGAVSLLNDIASEMVFPLVPKFVEQVLKANLKELGLIEGVSDSISSLMRLGAGGWSDRVGRRKPFIVLGYTLAVFARPVIGLATLPWHVLAARSGDRFGKGLRSAARDAMVAESVHDTRKGRAFAFRQAMDHIGATVGPLLALVFLWFFPENLRLLFLLTLAPGLAILVLLFWLRETVPQTAKRPRYEFRLAPLGSAYQRFLLVLGLFTLACSSDAFLLIWASRLGAADWELLMFWALFSAAKAAGNLWVGGQVDRRGARRFVVAGWLLYSLCYCGFAAATASWQVWLVLLVYSGYYALTEPAEKALVVELTGTAQKGLAFGWYHAILGLLALPASLLFGIVADAFGPLQGPRLAFIMTAGIALLASLLFLTLVPRREADL